MTKYKLFHNQDSRFWRPYERGDRLVEGWSGELSTLTIDCGARWESMPSGARAVTHRRDCAWLAEQRRIAGVTRAR